MKNTQLACLFTIILQDVAWSDVIIYKRIHCRRYPTKNKNLNTERSKRSGSLCISSAVFWTPGSAAELPAAPVGMANRMNPMSNQNSALKTFAMSYWTLMIHVSESDGYCNTPESVESCGVCTSPIVDCRHHTYQMTNRFHHMERCAGTSRAHRMESVADTDRFRCLFAAWHWRLTSLTSYVSKLIWLALLSVLAHGWSYSVDSP